MAQPGEEVSPVSARWRHHVNQYLRTGGFSGYFCSFVPKKGGERQNVSIYRITDHDGAELRRLGLGLFRRITNLFG